MGKTGRFVGIGVGPGDPELITYKAVRKIEECPVLAAPRSKDGEMTALDIVRQAADLEEKVIVPVDFLMQRDPAKRQMMYDRIIDDLCRYLDAGRDLAMITLGDVSVYSTAAYVADGIRERGYCTEMVPGVVSFSAVAARLGISLTDRDEPLIVIPASAKGLELERYLMLRGTKVLMKAGRHIDEVFAALKTLGLLEKSSMVANCGMRDEKVYETLDGLSEVPNGYFTTIIVRD